MSRVSQLLNNRYEARRPRLSGRVTSTPLDADGKSPGYIIVTIGNQTGVKVYVGPNDVYYAGDAITVEQRGGAAMASYYASNYTPGARPTSGNWEITTSTSLGAASFSGGDLVWGDPASAFFHMDYSEGSINMQVGSSPTGKIDAASGVFIAGNASAAHGRFSSTGIRFNNATSPLNVIDTASGIIMYSGSEQRMRIKPDGSGWLAGSGGIWWDTIGNISLAGSMAVTGITVTNGSNTIWINDAGDGQVAVGGASKANAPFKVANTGSVRATTACISGSIFATAGYFTGSIYALEGYISNNFYVGTASPRIHLDGVNKYIQSTNFSACQAGFRLEGATGDAEFNNVSMRGTMRAASLEYGQIMATNGSVWITLAAGKTAAAVASANSPTTFTIDVEDASGLTHANAGNLWAVNDIVRMKEGSSDLWATIGSKSDQTTFWRLTVTKNYPGPGFNPSFTAGATVINYGQSGNGTIQLTADSASAPYISLATHAGQPYLTMTERVRLGNLNGITGASGYGLWSDNVYLTGHIILTNPSSINTSEITNDAGWGPTASTVRTFAQTSIPTASNVGDLWFDTDDNNKVYRAAAIGSDEIKAGEWVLVTGSISGSGIFTYYQTGIPTASHLGDLWIDTDDGNKLYYAAASGADEIKAGEWILIQDSTCAAKTATNFFGQSGCIVNTPTPSGSGLYLGQDHLGYWAGTAWKTYMDNTGKFYFSGSTGAMLAWDGADLYGSDGTIRQWSATASTGRITAGGGNLIIGSNGLELANQGQAFIFKINGNEIARQYANNDGGLTFIMSSSGTAGITDGGFESGSSEWTASLVGSGSVSRSASAARTGNYGMRLRLSGSGQANIGTGYINIGAGDPTLITYWNRYGDGSTCSITGIVSATVRWYTSSNSPISVESYGVSRQSGWQQHTISTIAPATTAKMKVEIDTFTTGSNIYDIHIDDVYIKAASGNQCKFDMGPYGVAADIGLAGDFSVSRQGIPIFSLSSPPPTFVPLSAPLKSTAWDGDARSTTSKTLIDLSSVFSASAGLKAILVYVGVRDSGAGTTDAWLNLSPNNTHNEGLWFSCPPGNDRWGQSNAVVPCDANGDIYYQCSATGANTLDAYLQIWGYWI